MKRTENKWMMRIATLALLTGMVIAFLQGVYVYADAEKENTAAVTATVENEEVTADVILEDEMIPGANLPAVEFPWWCWVIAIGAIAAGCGTYGFVQYQEKR